MGQLAGGKRIAAAVYLHCSALGPRDRELVEQAIALAGIAPVQVAVCKFHVDEPVLSLLDYPGFWTEAFPLLHNAWTVYLDSGEVTHRSYPADRNPPVLHRKEQMLAADHPDRPRFAALTAQAEAAGLFDDPAIIGHAAGWEEELAARGLAVQDHTLVEAPPQVYTDAWRAQRHRTALSRTGLSSPVQALWRAGLLGHGASFFDYGCGRGDDIALLGDRGLQASGWDPWFRPQAQRLRADCVNLGFVLNVIEDLAERREALRGAWQLTGKVLSVAALIGGRTAHDRWRLYQDGVLTSRGTFQKYFTHSELGAYITDALGREPVPVQPGVYLVFRTDEDEQDFLASRQQSRPHWQRMVLPRRPPRPREPRPVREPRERVAKPARVSRWALHPELLDSLWHISLALGRLPDAEEWPDHAACQQALSKPERVLAHLLAERGTEALDAARTRRMADLLVYLALQTFARRKSFGHLSQQLQRDIRAFWASHGRALDAARELLFSAGRREVVEAASEVAAADRIGFVERDPDGSVDALFLRGHRLAELPAVLRVFVGCAGRLYGELETADVLKLHIRSSKVTAQNYDDFDGQRVPSLIERVKVDLRRQDIDVFSYDTEAHPPQPLWRKSRYLLDDEAGQQEQAVFERELEAATGLNFEGFGPGWGEVRRKDLETSLCRVGKINPSEVPVVDLLQ